MIAPYDEPAWLALVTLQDGVVSRQQCRDHGITDDQVRRRIHERTWRTVHRGVYATHTGTLSHTALVTAALLAVRRRAAASHQSALWLASAGRRVSPAKVHIAVVEGMPVQAPSGVRVHWLPDLGEARVLWNCWPPRVRTEHAVLDVVHATRDRQTRIGVLAQVVRERLTTADRLREVLEARPRVHDRRLIADVLYDVGAGAHSPLEVRDLRNDRAHGLAGGQRQVVAKREGRRDWLDVVYRGNGLRREVVKELDGRLGHDDEEGHWRDMHRDNAAEERDQSHLRYGWRDLAGRPCAVAAQLHVVLVRNGWRTPIRRCGRACSADTSMIR
jgi:hypothetical protein